MEFREEVKQKIREQCNSMPEDEVNKLAEEIHRKAERSTQLSEDTLDFLLGKSSDVVEALFTIFKMMSAMLVITHLTREAALHCFDAAWQESQVMGKFFKERQRQKGAEK